MWCELELELELLEESDPDMDACGLAVHVEKKNCQ